MDSSALEVDNPHLPAPEDLVTDEELSELLRELDHLEAWLADLRPETEAVEVAMTEGPGGTMGVAEYARHRGESRASVYKALKERRIRAVEGSDPVRIDVGQADQEWQSTTRTIFPADGKPAAAPTPPATTPRPRSGNDHESLLRARLANELLKAKRTRIELEQMQGKLAPRAEIEQAYLDNIADAKAALEVIPVRVCDRLIGLDRQAIRTLLTQEISNALRGLTHGTSDPASE
jgi:hypothetical protein